MNLVICHYSFYLRSTLTPPPRKGKGHAPRSMQIGGSSTCVIDSKEFCRKILKEYTYCDTVSQKSHFAFLIAKHQCIDITLLVCKSEFADEGYVRSANR
jgi:hypothetical protein